MGVAERRAGMLRHRGKPVGHETESGSIGQKKILVLRAIGEAVAA